MVSCFCAARNATNQHHVQEQALACVNRGFQGIAHSRTTRRVSSQPENLEIMKWKIATTRLTPPPPASPPSSPSSSRPSPIPPPSHARPFEAAPDRRWKTRSQQPSREPTAKSAPSELKVDSEEVLELGGRRTSSNDTSIARVAYREGIEWLWGCSNKPSHPLGLPRTTLRSPMRRIIMILDGSDQVRSK